MTFELKLEGDEGINSMNVWGDAFLPDETASSDLRGGRKPGVFEEKQEDPGYQGRVNKGTSSSQFSYSKGRN
jgi:hypothetical protein